MKRGGPFAAVAVLLLMLVVLTACSTGAMQPTPTPTLTTAPTETVSCDIQWNEAEYHIGEYKTVCGPVVDTHYASTSSGQPTFLNLGKAYPNPDRFTVVIWGDDRDSFPGPPEDYYYGKHIAVTGLIQEYEGSAEVFVSGPSQIQEY
jgi:DNA/RNA endonuclease YhcR with UshA esterase domain